MLPDFEFLWNFKNENSYIFTAENSNKSLEREALTKLLRDTNDIEFVRQAIGHAKIDTNIVIC